MTDSDIFHKLTNSAFRAFWNEYLLKVNCYRRRSVPLSKSNAWFSVLALGPDNRMKHRLWAIRWLVATLCNCLYLIVAPRVRASGPISLIPSVIHLKYLDSGGEIYRVGLHNFRFHKYPHILSVLTILDKCRGLWCVLKHYKQFIISCRDECCERGVDFEIFRRLCNIGYLRFADYILQYMALKKFECVEVSIAGQFDLNASFLSIYRTTGLDFSLLGYQHGLFELPPEPHQYTPIYFDEYHLLFRESEPWFVNHFLDNPECVIKYRKHSAHINWHTLDHQSFDKVIAFAAQESTPYDLKIIDTVLSYAEDRNALLLIYLHSNYRDFFLQHRIKSRNLKIFLRERHKNIDLLITRYSTLAMDYRTELGINVLFVPGSDSVCILESGNMPICRDLTQMHTTLAKLLDP